MIDITRSHVSDEWETPEALFAPLEAVFHFQLDPAATIENNKAWISFTKEHDGLSRDWIGQCRALGAPPIVWLNPPYSELDRWLSKAAEEANRGAVVVALIASRTGRRSFQTTVWEEAMEVWFLGGRVPFVRPDAPAVGATFDSALAIFGPWKSRRLAGAPRFRRWDWRREPPPSWPTAGAHATTTLR